MADAKGKQLEVFVSKTEAELLSGEPNVLGLSSDRNTIVFNGKVVGSGANIHYKKIAISSSGTGWYRFAVNRGGFASQPSAIFCIERSFGQRKNEHYLFASTRNHAGFGNITQLAGYHNGGNGHFITKIRFAQKTSSANTDSCFLDFYTTAETGETYYVWIIGNWNALDIYKVDDEEEDQPYTYQVIETSLGFMPSEYTEFRNKLFGDLSVGDGTPTDAMYVVTNGASGYETNWYKRPFSLVWTYIKSKIASVLGLTETSLKIGSHTEFKSDGDVEMQYGSTYGNYNKALGYQSYGGLASGVDGKPYAQFAALPTLAMTVDGGTTYFAEALPSASLTYTYDGTEHSYTNSSAYTQWIVIINHADFLGSGVFPFNKCYFFGGRVLLDVVIASSTELTEGSGIWQVVLTSSTTSTNTYIDRTVSGELRALVASTSVTAYGTAAGRQSFVGGYYSNAFGYRSGTGAVNYANAFGIQSYCGSTGALALGMYAIAVGHNSIAAGYRSYAKYNNSVALGYEAMALHAYANAFGAFTKTGRQHQTALGYYNEGKSDTLLEVGYGSSSARKNVFEVTTGGVAKATRFEGRLGKQICTFDKSYVNAVVLLCKVDAWSGYMTLVGKIFVEQSGVNRFASYDVAMHYSTGASSVYNSRFYLSGNSYDAALNLHLVQCTYNGEKWWALQKKGIQQTTMYFTGYDYNVSWEMIEYYKTNTSTVLNEEINNSIVNCDDVLQLPTKPDGTKAVYEDKVLAQYLANSMVVGTANSGSTNANKYVRFASIDISAKAWGGCWGTIIMTDAENTALYGIASFNFRAGTTATTPNMRSVRWEVLSDTDYADSIKVVMTSDNVYDLYFQPKGNYIAARFEFITKDYAKLTLRYSQSYVDSIDAVASSSLTGKVSYATTAGSADTATSADTASAASSDMFGNPIYETYERFATPPFGGIDDTEEPTVNFTAGISDVAVGSIKYLTAKGMFVAVSSGTYYAVFTGEYDGKTFSNDDYGTVSVFGSSGSAYKRKTYLLTTDNSLFGFYGDSFERIKSGATQKLSSTHTLWGQDFDGTADVTGDIVDVHAIVPETADTYYIGTSTLPFKGVYTQLIATPTDGYLRMATGSNTAIYAKSGAVTIGAYSSPTAKLDVRGCARTYNSNNTELDDINATASDTNAWNVTNNNALRLENNNNLMAFIVDGTSNGRAAIIQVGHSGSQYANYTGTLYLNKFGGKVYIGKVEAATVESTVAKAKADASGNVIAETYIKSIEAKGGTLEVTKGDDTTESVAIPNHEVLQFDGIITDEITVNAQSVTAWNYIYWASSVGAFVAAVTTLSTDGTTTAYYGNFDNGTIRLADYTDNKLYRETGTSNLYTLVDGTLTQTTAGSAAIATKAVGDSVGNNIVNTYFSNVTVSGNRMTFTKPSGATKTVTIAKASGLTYGSGIQRTEMIQCDSEGFTCITNSAITALPSTLNGGMFWLNAGSDMIVSTPFAITTTQVSIPIKYMTDTTKMTWVDAVATVKASTTGINVIVRDASTGTAYGSVSVGTFKVQGYITGEFTES